MPFFYYLWYGAIYKRQYTDKHVTLSKCMCMRASGASELRKCWHFHILKLLFLSIFCWYIENKSWFNFIGGGASAPPPPPSPPTSTPVFASKVLRMHLSNKVLKKWKGHVILYSHVALKVVDLNQA